MACRVPEKPTDDEFHSVNDILTRLIVAKTRVAHNEARAALSMLAKSVAMRGVLLNLSDEKTFLGARMARANEVAREKGWIL